MTAFVEAIERGIFEAGRPFAPKGETPQDMISWLRLQKSPTASRINWFVARHAREHGFDTEEAYQKLASLDPFKDLDADAYEDWTQEERKQVVIAALVSAGARSIIVRSEAAFVSAFDHIQRAAKSSGLEVSDSDMNEFFSRLKETAPDLDAAAGSPRLTSNSSSTSQEKGGGGGGLIAILALAGAGLLAYKIMRK